MADYVDRNILCQAYVHVEVEQDFEECVRILRSVAVPLVQERASFFLYEEADVDLRPDEGSVKSRITVLGTLFLAMQGISNYKDFREGVILLSNDVQRVAEVAATETLYALKARNKDVVRIEIRTGVVGQLRRVIADIDRIKDDNGKISSRRQAQRLEALQEDVERLIDNLRDADDVYLVADELYLLIQTVPEAPLPGPKERQSELAADLYRRRRQGVLGALDRRRRLRSKDD